MATVLGKGNDWGKKAKSKEQNSKLGAGSFESRSLGM